MKTLALALGALAFALAPRVASADPVTFTVNEGTVPDASVNSFEANKITGDYVEYLFLTPTATGFDFTTVALATWKGYSCIGCAVPSPGDQLNGFGANNYNMYALFSASGTFNGVTFTPSSADFNLFIDPFQDSIALYDDLAGTITLTATDTDDDYELLSSSTLQSGSGAITGTGTAGPQGQFDLLFRNLSFTNTTTCPAGTTNTNLCGGVFFFNFPTGLTLVSDVNGDFDGNFNPLGGPQTAKITGDLSAVFFDATVPEPASLTLLGIGLVGAGISRRRKKASKA